MDQVTKKLIREHSPMWTNKQIWEFEQVNEELTFDTVYAERNNFESWKTKFANPDSVIRDLVVRTFDNFFDGYELWISNKDHGKLDSKYVAYLMSVMADIMIEEEVCLNFRIDNDCLVVRIDEKADVIDCKEFFEEFYHLATGFNFDTDTGIPDDETEAEMYLTRLQEEFDVRMKNMLGDKYLPGNNDPDTLNAKD
ncbi:MAG: hypothetical protein OPY06_04900 [Nitrosopumilus sp.]|nr:hypothetical protein [Nitrosopumilus sp.]MDF2423173.1 hypothetical protein [Nitrosopumilus sp.]MDF2424113.1 hypothetical protein [Nitrosopumilus sp.]MDF2426014.1 hypothetical protein [Nitrosopumilus sp.]MDF2427516.1 hypothetical protein [Nitrosopumilus sp.]